MSHRKWTVDDVQALVKAADMALANIRHGAAQPGGATDAALSAALKPFQPDPDDGLIEAMCRGFEDVWSGKDHWDMENDEPYKDRRRDSMRAALAVARNSDTTVK